MRHREQGKSAWRIRNGRWARWCFLPRCLTSRWTGRAIFKQEWLQYRPYEDLEYRPTRNFLTVDTKGTDAKFDGTDYIGLTLNFVDQDNNWNLMSFKMKLSTKELVDLFFNWTERYKLEVLGYKRTQFTEGLQQCLQDQMRLRNKFLPLRELSHRATAKQVRIQQALESRYHRRGIFHLTVGGSNQCKDPSTSC
jgi:hypothetical protein